MRPGGRSNQRDKIDWSVLCEKLWQNSITSFCLPCLGCFAAGGPAKGRFFEREGGGGVRRKVGSGGKGGVGLGPWKDQGPVWMHVGGRGSLAELERVPFFPADNLSCLSASEAESSSFFSALASLNVLKAAKFFGLPLRSTSPP